MTWTPEIFQNSPYVYSEFCKWTLGFSNKKLFIYTLCIKIKRNVYNSVEFMLTVHERIWNGNSLKAISQSKVQDSLIIDFINPVNPVCNVFIRYLHIWCYIKNSFLRLLNVFMKFHDFQITLSGSDSEKFSSDNDTLLIWFMKASEY